MRGMDGDTRYSIGDLARRTGLSVRTIRFYSDRGLLPPTSRSPAGYRRYDLDALARLDLVRTLRDLGVDLATIGRVLDHEISVPEVAAAHAQALEVQIRTLRLRRAVLGAVAKRGSSPQEMELMHKLVKLSDAERRRIIHQFIDEAFGDLDANPDMVAMLRSAMPELSDDPTPEQARLVLAELVGRYAQTFGKADTPDYRIQALQHHPDPTTTPACARVAPQPRTGHAPTELVDSHPRPLTALDALRCVG